MRHLQLISAFTLFASVASAQMYRDGPPPPTRLIYRDLNVVRVNPLGLITDARFQYRYRLFESESPALRDNFVSAGLAPVLSGGFARIGPIVEVQPLTVLQVWALYEFVSYFGNFNYLQSFPTADSRYSDPELARLGALPAGDPAKNYGTTGTQLMFGANLQLKFGHVVARSQLRLGRPDFKLRAGDTLFYDPFYDLLVSNRGWFFNNDADFLWQSDGNWTAGIRYTAAQAFYSDANFAAPQDRANAPGAIHRAGPLFAYTWKKADGARFEPTLLAVVNWWLSSPTRTGQEGSRFLPYMVLGLAMTGDVLTPSAQLKN